MVGGIPTPLKNMSSSVGMMTFPTEWKKNMFQTTNQIYMCFNIDLQCDLFIWYLFDVSKVAMINIHTNCGLYPMWYIIVEVSEVIGVTPVIIQSLWMTMT